MPTPVLPKFVPGTAGKDNLLALILDHLIVQVVPNMGSARR
jgi:hypothetical protein